MGDTTPPPPSPTVAARVLELTPDGLRRRFLLVIPAGRVAALHARRLRELGLGAPAAESGTQPPWPPAVRERVTSAALADACRRAGAEALDPLLQRLPSPAVGTPRIETLAGPPDGDLILRAEVWTLPEVTPPDPAALRIERPVAEPDPAEVERALVAFAALRAGPMQLPAGTPATPGDEVVCDIAAHLLPAENRIPQPTIAGARAGAPGELPEGWSFGDNGAGLAAEVLEVATTADPPFIRLRVHGATATDGQSFVIFHPAQAIRVAPGATWVGSVAVRPVGTPVGLRGSKLRLQSQPPSGEGSLRRKDAALTLRGDRAGLVRCYVSDKMIEAETAFLRMPLLFDHAAGRVDFTLDIAAPRLVEGLDLGDEAMVPLPEFSGRSRRFTIGDAPDALGLAPHLAGVAAGETREVALTLPRDLEDRAIAGRQARFEIRVSSVLRRGAPTPDDALARARGFAGLDAMRAFVVAQVARGYAEMSQRAARRALRDALLAAAGDIPLPDGAVRAEFAALWPRLVGAGQQKGTEPPRQDAVMALAARRLRLGLLLAAVARRHGLEPAEADLRAAAAALPRGADPSPDALRRQVLEDRVLAFLLERAQVTDRVVTPRELIARGRR